ncbi:hypothetical protein BE21_54485 [Sorangium cellulosum]|uniref:Uncharacterized protein n=1 Tax=Sorangium cellulosum TaxID=56 RepID=A0A150TDX3_SORCE|nr:hypothetical protein BE21_54485 [Sorangium cellulosum]
MSTSSGWQDPLGRPRASIARVVIAALTALAITGSAWPTQARSMRPSYDTWWPTAGGVAIVAA